VNIEASGGKLIGYIAAVCTTLALMFTSGVAFGRAQVRGDIEVLRTVVQQHETRDVHPGAVPRRELEAVLGGVSTRLADIQVRLERIESRLQ